MSPIQSWYFGPKRKTEDASTPFTIDSLDKLTLLKIFLNLPAEEKALLCETNKSFRFLCTDHMNDMIKSKADEIDPTNAFHVIESIFNKKQRPIAATIFLSHPNMQSNPRNFINVFEKCVLHHYIEFENPELRKICLAALEKSYGIYFHCMLKDLTTSKILSSDDPDVLECSLNVLVNSKDPRMFQIVFNDLLRWKIINRDDERLRNICIQFMEKNTFNWRYTRERYIEYILEHNIDIS